MTQTLTDLLPHRPPMVFIDTIECCGPDSATASMMFTPHGYGVEGDRVLETALIESIAQTVAAMAGSAAKAQGLPVGAGMLVGLSDFCCVSTARPGVPVALTVVVTRRLAPFCFVHGEARQEGTLVASGELKFFIEGGHE